MVLGQANLGCHGLRPGVFNGVSKGDMWLSPFESSSRYPVPALTPMPQPAPKKVIMSPRCCMSLCPMRCSGHSSLAGFSPF